jgi:putative flavoprotein involved in K+ transport
MDNVLDVVVIGGGHAGLSISHNLTRLNFRHLVLEKGRIGDSWRNQRWDSFRLNTPNNVNLLPGVESCILPEDGFCSAQEFVSWLENYRERFDLPVRENCRVLSLTRTQGSSEFTIVVDNNGKIEKYCSKQVVIASGGQNKKIIPAFSGNIASGITQLHTCDYRNGALLPEGAVLMIGCAQSGIQIAEDLIDHGKRVYVSSCPVGRFPRRYRGKDIVHWLLLTGFFDQHISTVTDEQIFLSRQPQISGTGLLGHTLSLQSLAKKGLTILGKTDTAKGRTIFLQSNAAAHIKYADEFSEKVKAMVDKYIELKQLSAPPPETDPADYPDFEAESATNISKLELKENNIKTIIWATGYTGDFSYIKLPVFNSAGIPEHCEGVSAIGGLFFLGLPWLRKRKSGIITGIKEDSEFIAEKVLSYSKSLLSKELEI